MWVVMLSLSLARSLALRLRAADMSWVGFYQVHGRDFTEAVREAQRDAEEVSTRFHALALRCTLKDSALHAARQCACTLLAYSRAASSMTSLGFQDQGQRGPLWGVTHVLCDPSCSGSGLVAQYHGQKGGVKTGEEEGGGMAENECVEGGASKEELKVPFPPQTLQNQRTLRNQ
eukprot:3306415-Rhodomonas_salina.2